ncbi:MULTISPECIES: hypothetical protein [unclassified Sulfitobacter]|uniref:hypothetical protein n=1 Tax=unclassified Sulfitobacter TaxID=196795 RepID=UPI0023E2657A|nr:MULTISPECIES: hypothetical protein [unclassified Sulfitobacter]MDF3381942.1 hypothetical protein [Sulfitobacter sp. Ks11]MDF3385361.1 hypothetical protein [Sulfitobacter sp. M85]MDF3388780.1 hypothetical protein [Sulfitobacter sp. Ks16]MDF3399417.1 hypothetical protein [Sulfitobacter sp. KE39]MDF3402838.1 hypothetical protein [Sulfitobacter sp. Ks35]
MDEGQENTVIGFGYIQIGLLLEKVRQAGGSIPSKYYVQQGCEQDAVRAARLKLGGDISNAFMWYDLHPRLTQKGAANKRLKALVRIESRMASVLEDINENGLANEISPLVRRNVDTGVGYHEIVDGMDALRKAVMRLRRETGDPEPPLKINQSQNSLLLERLTKVYREGIGMDPLDGLGRNYHDLSGPFPEFLRSAYQLRGLERPSDAGLEKALERAGLLGASDNH